MGIILIGLIIVLLFGGLGFAVHLLWWIAIIALIIWLVGFFARGTGSGGSRGRWYRW